MHLKAISLTLGLALLATNAATAADLTGDAPKGETEAGTWKGLYVGGSVGASFNRNSWNNNDDPNRFLDPAAFSFSSTKTNIVGGIHAGVGQQFQNLVFGIEAGYEFLGSKGTGQPTSFAQLQTKQDFIASFVGRMGYVAASRLMIYTTAGFAYTDYKFSNFDASPGFGTFAVNYPSQSSFGWTTGVGGEYMLSKDWTLGLDWKHYQFGNLRVESGLLTGTGPAAGPGFDRMNFSNSNDIVSVRISKKF